MLKKQVSFRDSEIIFTFVHLKTDTMFTKAVNWTGRLFQNYVFPTWEWMRDHISPNKVFIFILFVGVASWIYVQGQYNKEAEKNGTIK
jgi:hypothetical protein